MYIYIYIYIYIYNQDKFCLYNSFNILSSFLISVLRFRSKVVEEFLQIVPSAFEPFVGHHQGLLACVRRFVFFFKALKVYTITKIRERRMG